MIAPLSCPLPRSLVTLLLGAGWLLASASCAKQLPVPPPAAPPAQATPAAQPAPPPPTGVPAPPPPSAPPEEDGPITELDRSAVLTALITTLDQRYVFPEKAAAIGQKLRDRQQRGAYASLDRGLAFAQRLTEEMGALAHDKHLVVRYFERPVPPPMRDDAPPALDAAEADEMRYLNHGVFEVRRMRFNLGYLTFNVFGRPAAAAAEKLGAAMRLLADTQGLIIDLRECRGGDTDTVTLAESYFFPAKTHLLDMYDRTTNVTEKVYAIAELAGPRYAASKPVLIVIGESTASGCEGFAYALQGRRRATVIGGRSAGAAYFGGPRRLTDHFMAFIPVGRPIDPITHGDWDGTGVIPQIEATPDRAPAIAERTLLQLLEPQERNERRRASMQQRIAELR